MPCALRLALVLVVAIGAGNALSTTAAAQGIHPPDDSRGAIGLFPSDPDLSRFVLAFPRQPNGQAAFDRLFALDLAAFQQAGRQRGDTHYVPMLYAFLVHVARRQPALLDAAVARAIAEKDSAGGAARMLVVHDIVYFSGIAGKQPLLLRIRGVDPALGQRMAAGIKGSPVFPYPAMTPTHPQHLDILWAAFFGSSDPRYLDRISLCLAHWKPWPEIQARLGEIKAAFNAGDPPARAEFFRFVCAISAYRFLRNNAAAHPDIIPIWLAMASASGPVAPVQRAILEEIKSSLRR